MGEFDNCIESIEPGIADLTYYQQVFLEKQTIVLDPELPEQEPLPARSEDRFRNRVSRDSQVLERVLPYNTIAERVVLGTYLVHPNKRGRHDRSLSDCFYFDNHRRIHLVMRNMEHLDLHLLTHQLQMSGDLEFVGGVAELVKLHEIGKKINPDHLLDYVKIIRDHAMRRGLIMISSQGLRAGYDLVPDVGGEIDSLLKALKRLRRGRFDYYGNL